MAEATGKGKLRRILGRAGLGLLSLVLMAAVYVGAVLIHSPESEEGSFVVQEEPEAVTRLQASSSDDPAALARLFGARLPVVPGLPMTGETRNASHDGQAARMAILRYNGATLSAVRPASAAPLLMRPEMSVELRSGIDVQNLPVMLCGRNDAWSAYFADETAAYEIYAPQASREDFLALLDRIEWVQ